LQNLTRDSKTCLALEEFEPPMTIGKMISSIESNKDELGKNMRSEEHLMRCNP
jgi:hypothetical protein